ncbi:galactosylceramide sulfotransferase-like [Glandiceps talaboti]
MPDTFIDDVTPSKMFLPPIGVRQGEYANYKYDIASVHMKYNHLAINRFMNHKPIYITILRDPVAQTGSMFSFFNFGDALSRFQQGKQLSGEDLLDMFYRYPNYYRKFLPHKGDDIRNNQFYYLGLRPEHMENKTVVKKTIRKLDKEFNLVLLTEYFDESLVLLKKLLCWDVADVVYLPKNVGKTIHETTSNLQTHIRRWNLSADLEQRIRKWNSADVALYDHFRDVLFRKIKEYGKIKFSEDLKALQIKNEGVFKNCVNGTNETKRSMEFTTFSNSSTFCTQVSMYYRDMFIQIWNRQSVKVNQIY